MENIFIKTSAGSGATVLPKEYEDLAKRLEKLEKKKDARDVAKETLTNSTTNTKEMSLIKQITNLAGKQGLNAERLMEELTKRQFLIRRLLAHLNEDLIAAYFNKSLVEYKIPLSKTYDLMEKALTTTKTGVTLSDALDFAIEHYNRNRDVETTEYILESASELHGKIPNLNVMNILKNSLVGGESAAMNFLALGPNNVEMFPLFMELMSLTQAKPDEDLTKLRIQYEKNRDELMRAMEIDFRYKAIFQTLLTDEFHRVLTRNVQLITTLFKLSTQSKEVVAARRILTQLQLGQAFLQQIESDIQQTDPSKAMQREKRRSSDRSEIVTAQVQQKTDLEKNKNVDLPREYRQELLNKLIVPLISAYSNLLTQINANDSRLKDELRKNVKEDTEVKKSLALYQNQKKAISDVINGLKTVRSYLQGKDAFTVGSFTEKFYSSFDGFKSSTIRDNKIDSGLSEIFKPTTAFVDNKFIKLAQAQTNIQLPAWTANINNINAFAGKIAQLAAGGIFVSGLINLDPIKMIGGALGLFFYQNNINLMKDLEKIGLPAPKDESTEAERIQAEDAFRNFMQKTGQYQTFIKIKNLLDVEENNIADLEKKLIEIASAEIQTGTFSGNTQTVTFKDARTVESAYKSFMIELRDSLNMAKAYRKFMIGLEAQVNQPSQELLSAVGPNNFVFYRTSIRPWRIAVENLVLKFEKLYYKYSSFNKVVYNMQVGKVLQNELATLLPEYEKYLATGTSIVDLVSASGGIGEKLKDIINNERSARDILFKSIVDLKKLNPDLQPSGSSTVDSVNILNPSARTAGTKSFYFDNLIIEKKDKIQNILNPETLAKQLTDNFKFSQTITEPTTGNLETSEVGVEPQQVIYSNPERVKNYQAKINAKKNLGILYDYILAEPQDRLNPNEKEFLLNQIRIETFSHYQNKIQNLSAPTSPDENKNSKNFDQLEKFINGEKKLNNNQKTILISYINNWRAGQRNIIVPNYTETGNIPSPAPITPEVPVAPPPPRDPDIFPGNVTPSEESLSEAQQAQQRIFNQLNTELQLNLKADDFKEEPKQVLQSLIEQWKQSRARVNNLQRLYNEILMKGEISGLSSLASKNTKFIKLANKESDQKNIDYVSDYMNELYEDSDDKGYDYLEEDLPYGEALRNPEKWRKVPTKEIKK